CKPRPAALLVIFLPSFPFLATNANLHEQIFDRLQAYRHKRTTPACCTFKHFVNSWKALLGLLFVEKEFFGEATTINHSLLDGSQADAASWAVEQKLINSCAPHLAQWCRWKRIPLFRSCLRLGWQFLPTLFAKIDRIGAKTSASG